MNELSVKLIYHAIKIIITDIVRIIINVTVLTITMHQQYNVQRDVHNHSMN